MSDNKSSKHGPNICDCKEADECPYWKKELNKYGLSMRRGLKQYLIYGDVTVFEQIAVQRMAGKVPLGGKTKIE